MATIPEYFEGQSVLISGATGFVGKVLVEKLLRSCPGVERLFLLVRPKKGLSPQERWRGITGVPLFDKLKKINPRALDKVLLIDSDMAKCDLGLSERDRQFLIKNTTIIYHNAAAVQFSSSVADSLNQNTRSTIVLLEMASLMPNLKAFVHVSTTYANIHSPSTEWKEKVYPASQDWRVMLKLTDTEEYALSVLQYKILGGHTNPYTFTKHLAENVLVEYSHSHLLPIIICRPSLVICTQNDPFPSWTDSINGFTALATGVALGIVRVGYLSWEAYQDFIPVDKVAKALIVAPWRQGKENSKSGVAVYNVTLGDEYVVRNREISKFTDAEYFPTSKYMVWPPSLTAVSNINLFYLLGFLKMVLPFYFLDVFLELTTGAKPRLIPILKKVYSANVMLKSFSHMQITFPKENYDKLKTCLEPKDKEDFDLDTSNYDPMNEMHKNFIGILKYYLKEDVTDESLKKYRGRRKRLEFLSKSLTLSFYALTAWISATVLLSTESWKSLSAEYVLTS